MQRDVKRDSNKGLTPESGKGLTPEAGSEFPPSDPAPTARPGAAAATPAMSAGAKPAAPPFRLERPPKARPETPSEMPPEMPPPRNWIVPAAIAAVLTITGSGWWFYHSATAPKGGVASVAGPVTARNSDDVAQLQQTLRQEREKAEKMARQLDTAWRTLASQAIALADAAARDQELADLRQVLGQQSEVQLLAQESARSHGPEAQLEERPANRPANRPDHGNDVAGAEVPAVATPAPPTLASAPPPAPPIDSAATTPRLEPDQASSPVADRPATDMPAAVSSPASEQVPVSAGTTSAAKEFPAALEVHENLEQARLVARARLLLDQGNVAAARSMLEHAVETGSASALLVLAETYDPAFLSEMGTVGTLGDIARAEDLYVRAFAAGVPDAKERLSRLHR